MSPIEFMNLRLKAWPILFKGQMPVSYIELALNDIDVICELEN